MSRHGRDSWRCCRVYRRRKGEASIKLATLTPFWHRRVCEATILIDAIIMGLFVWTNTSGISQSNTDFNVSVIAAGLAAASLVVSAVSYFYVPDKYHHYSAFAGYALLLGSVGLLTAQTGTSDSPFLALWMVASVFSGIFGAIFSLALLSLIIIFAVWALFTGALTSNLAIGVALAGFLPVMISYLLWHGKANGDASGKSQSYYDLANELDQVSGKAEVVINAINDGVIAINSQGNIELINPAAQRIVGWGHQDALNLNYKSILQILTKDGNDVGKSNDPVFETLSTNQPTKRNNLQLQTSAGKRIDIEIVVQPLGLIGNGAIIVFSDVTKERAEENAQAEFISTASHEMRTPVASIEGYLGLALNPATAKIDDKARDFITKAHASAKHLGQLFQDLLGVTKAEDGRMRNNPKVIDMVTFTSEIVEGLRQKAEEKHLRLFFKPSTDDAGVGGSKAVKPVFFVNVDPDHLREVLNNLVENAIKYTPEGEVVIDVRGDNEHVLVTITDSGIGIPAEDIPHLFQKFYRVDNSDTREIGGTGLGLYLCRRLVEAMEGRIWVESEYKKGSTFSIEFPRISHEEANRLIEIGTTQTIDPAEARKNLDAQMAKNKPAAAPTPIVMEKTERIGDRKVEEDKESKAAAETGATTSADAMMAASPQGQNNTNEPKPSETQNQTLADIESSLQKAKTLHPIIQNDNKTPDVEPEPHKTLEAANIVPIEVKSAPSPTVPESPAPKPAPTPPPAAPMTNPAPAVTAVPITTAPATAAAPTPTSAYSPQAPMPPAAAPTTEHRDQPEHLTIEVPERK